MTASQRRRVASVWLTALIVLGVLSGVAYALSGLAVVVFFVGLPALWVHLVERRQARPEIFMHPRREAVVSELAASARSSR